MFGHRGISHSDDEMYNSYRYFLEVITISETVRASIVGVLLHVLSTSA